MKLLVLGSTGQVGWELQRALAPLGELVALDRKGADLERPDTLGAIVDTVAPDVIVNAAAYTAVDKAEAEPVRAETINAHAVGRLGQPAEQRGALLVHYSTDYVFDGSQATPYLETDPTGPLGVYGRTKLAGEEAIRQSGCRHLIFRTSWVHASRGANFVKTMLRLAREREELRVVADQIGAPTCAELIADVTAHAVRAAIKAGDELSGTYHLAAGGQTSWHEFARFIVEEALTLGADLKARPDAVRAISTADYPTPARRPAWSLLDRTKLETTFGLRLPDWQVGARRTVAELLGR